MFFDPSVSSWWKPSLLTFHSERNAAQTQLVSDLCDLFIPVSALGYINVDDGVVGLAGAVSSLIGLMAQWNKTA
jgi:peroxin-11B